VKIIDCELEEALKSKKMDFEKIKKMDFNGA